MDRLEELLVHQAGVVSRAQVLGVGLQPHDVRRMLRRREWARVHDGVYVAHTGPVSWTQRAWAGVLFAWPAALCHSSALLAVTGHGRHGAESVDPVHVAIARHRKVRAPEGLVVHRLARLDGVVQWNTSPPRVRLEEAVIDVAAATAGDFDAVAILANAVQSRRTTATRLRVALERRARVRRRAFLDDVLRDVESGASSALEYAYLTRVERPHGLPAAERQVIASGRGPLYRDVLYRRQSLVVELDGRLFHSQPGARDHDLERDLDAALGGLTTIRLGWGQVVARPCATALAVARLLQRRGWTREPTTCADCAPRSSRASW